MSLDSRTPGLTGTERKRLAIQRLHALATFAQQQPPRDVELASTAEVVRILADPGFMRRFARAERPNAWKSNRQSQVSR